ncbi:MAG: T9SS type A sorting domain-containing protein [Saprospiraceae bacterium]|nr:T9SS type A sorting domain-containing protein [Saprospiraceae bacterium]
MKFSYIFLVFLIASLNSVILKAQCNLNGTEWGSADAPTTCKSSTLSTCTYYSDYATMTNAVAGNTYQFKSTFSDGYGPYYFCIYDNNENGSEPVAFVAGIYSPQTINYTATANGPLYVQSFKAGCSVPNSGCHKYTVSCISCTLPIPTIATFQPSTSSANQGDQNQQVLRIDLSNICNQTLTNVNLTTGLTTNLADIVAAKIYYTTTATFSTNTQFGATVYSPGASFSFSGSQELTNGTGYLWVVYDISCSATVGNVIDASVIDATFSSGTAIPATPNPDGTREIAELTETVSTSQPSTTFVVPGSTDNPVLSMSVQGCGNLTNIELATTGSSNPSTDILNAKAYITTINTFSTAVQFGSAIANPDGTFAISGTYSSTSSNFYIWITYDISNTATNFNVVDAACTNITLDGGLLTPTTSNPAGTRLILTPPPNDVCSGAIELPSNGPFPHLTTTVSNTMATDDGDPTSGCEVNAHRGVWYEFTPAAPGTYTFSTCPADAPGNSIPDNVMRIYTSPYGCNGSFDAPVACNDDNCGLKAKISTVLASGTTYYILVYGYDTYTGNVQLHVSFTPLPGDICNEAIVIPGDGGGTFPYYTEVVSNEYATDEDDPTTACNSDTHRGIWFTFNPTASGEYNISSCQNDGTATSITDDVLSIYTSTNGCSGPFTQVACDDDGCTTLGLQAVINNVSLTEGVTYYILAFGYNTRIGNIQLKISTVPPPNDLCVEAINITPTPGIFTDPGVQTTFGATFSNLVSCEDENTSTDVWYKITTDSDGNPNENISITVTPTGEQMDAVITLYEGSACGSLTEVACVNENAAGEAETLFYQETGFAEGEIQIRDNTAYFIKVSDYYGVGEMFILTAGGSSLPVTILSFDAKALSTRKVLLSWKVADEVNIEDYVIERSTDGRSWSAIGSAKASKAAAYSFIDPSPEKGVNYYRLNIRERNRKHTLSMVRSVVIKGGGILAVYPNPAHSAIRITGLEDYIVTIKLYNEIGKVVQTICTSGSILATSGLNIVDLAPGVYVAQVKDSNRVQSIRFCKE